jgi:hypothetical protein
MGKVGVKVKSDKYLGMEGVAYLISKKAKEDEY